MNFTSQICTTKEQSERLMSLGLKKETADCILVQNPFYADEYVMFPIVDIDETLENEMRDEPIPAWSLHRLIKIYSKNSIIPMVKLDEIDFDWLVDNIAFRIKEQDIYKEYLKE